MAWIFEKHCQNTKIPKNPSEIIKLWNEREISNFEFLMWVNLFGNRSYRDIYQYPTFPWIIEDLSILDKLKGKFLCAGYTDRLGFLYFENVPYDSYLIEVETNNKFFVSN